MVSRIIASMAVSALLFAAPVWAEGYPWAAHAAPFDFLFGNNIDTHQQSRLGDVDGEKLAGFLYIRFTGEFTPEGLPMATGGHCDLDPEGCTVGWLLAGLRVQATLLAKQEGGHFWCVPSDALPSQPGFTHFHWWKDAYDEHGLVVGNAYVGYLMKLTAREAFHLKGRGGFDIVPGIDYYSHANFVVGCE